MNFFDGWGLSETQPRFWQPLSYACLHGDFWHLLGNGLLIWWTGDIVERTYGRRVFWLTLALGALAGAASWWLSGLGGPRDGGELIGASAAVYALMLVALLDKLEHQISLLLFFVIPVTLRVGWMLLIAAGLTLCGWAFAELPSRHAWSLWHPAWSDSLAHSAHLGGLLVGWFTFRWLNQTNLSVQTAQEEMAPPPPPHQHPTSSATTTRRRRRLPRSPASRPGWSLMPCWTRSPPGIRLAHPDRETQAGRPQRPPPLTPSPFCAPSPCDPS